MLPPPDSQLMQSLVEHGYAIVPDFLSRTDCGLLVAEITKLGDDGLLVKAGVGRGSQHQLRHDIRSDLVHWLEEESLSEPAGLAWRRLDELRQRLNRGLYLGLRRFEGHLTCYPIGSRYDRHIDNFAGKSSSRKLSCVLYLNEHWTDADGGQLRLYGRAADAPVVCDILPEAGKLVCFLSEEVPHEVLATHRLRYSLTGWFRVD